MFDEKVQVTAPGQISVHQVSVPALISYEYSLHAAGPINCLVIPEREALLGPILSQKSLELRAQRNDNFGIWIPSFTQTSFRTSYNSPLEIMGIADLLVEGNLEDREVTTNDWICDLYLPYTLLVNNQQDQVDGIPQRVPYYKTSLLERGDELTGINWQTSMGQAELVRAYLMAEKATANGHTREEMLQSKISIEINKDSSGTTQEIVHAIWKKESLGELDTACWLLSFLSKKRLQWYEATLRPRSLKGLSLYRETINLRRSMNPELLYSADRANGSRNTLIISQEELAGQAFATTVTNFNALVPNRRMIILRIIDFLLATYDTPYAEAQYGLIWVAFDMLLNELASNEDKLIFRAEPQFRAFKIDIEQLIDRKYAEYADDLKVKLDELKRTSFKRRLTGLAKRYDIDLSRFWNSDSKVSIELQRMISRRNSYIHDGMFELSDAIKDISRIRYLVSYWILKLLGFPVDKLNENESDLIQARRA